MPLTRIFLCLAVLIFLFTESSFAQIFELQPFKINEVNVIKAVDFKCLPEKTQKLFLEGMKLDTEKYKFLLVKSSFANKEASSQALCKNFPKPMQKDCKNGEIQHLLIVSSQDVNYAIMLKTFGLEKAYYLYKEETASPCLGKGPWYIVTAVK